MEDLKDVDEVLLAKANSLITYMHLNVEGVALKKTRIICLAEIPELLISFFELILEEPLSAEQKPFRTPYERSTTLQSIIDSLEQFLNLPLSHINGAGIAKLDRRQLDDVIQIFSDIIRQLFPSRPSYHQQQSVPEPTGKDNVINPDDDKPLTLEQLRTSQMRYHSGASFSNRKQHLVPSLDVSSSVPLKQRSPSVHPGVFRKEPSLDVSETLPKLSSVASIDTPSLTVLLSGAKSVTATRMPDRSVSGSTSSWATSQVKSGPAKVSQDPEKSGTSLSRKSSLSKPLVYPVKRKPSIRGSISSRTAAISSKAPVTSGPAKPLIMPIRRLSTRSDSSYGMSSRSAASPIEKSTRRTVGRRPSTKSIQSGHKVVTLPKSSASDDKTSKSAVRKTTQVATSQVAVATKRRPSVVSSKVRKQSAGHGTFSPRTISLASSVKLQQELEYHIKRLSEIEHEMETHIEALRCLQEEKVRLLAVIHHVKSSVSGIPAQYHRER